VPRTQRAHELGQDNRVTGHHGDQEIDPGGEFVFHHIIVIRPKGVS